MLIGKKKNISLSHSVGESSTLTFILSLLWEGEETRFGTPGD